MTRPPWDQARIAAATSRGPHQPSHQGIEFLCEDLIQDLPGLRLSPLGLVPQQGRRPLMISNYTYLDVNKVTIPLAPEDSMQFGHTLRRLVTKVYQANSHFGPVYMSKIDLSDGFYQVQLKPEDTMKLGVLFLSRQGEPPLIGICLTNPMGWKSSPPNFCACTKTIANLANASLATGLAQARRHPHRLDRLSEAPVPPEDPPVESPLVKLLTDSTTPNKRPIRYWDVYVDDFCGLAQVNWCTRQAIKRALFQSLDKVFWPFDSQDIPFWQEPASLKKMLKGDAAWTTKKPATSPCGLALINGPRHPWLHWPLLYPPRSLLAPGTWQKLTPPLQKVAGEGPLSLAYCPCQASTKYVPGYYRGLRCIRGRHGGNPFSPLPNGCIQPLMWRTSFPTWVPTQLVVTFDNPTAGTITNSDLELAESIAHYDVLEQALCVTTRTTHNCYNNTAASLWDCIPGPVKHLTNLLSRSDLSDTALLHGGLCPCYREIMSSSSLQDGTVTNLASVMLNNGTYSFLPDKWLSLIHLWMHLPSLAVLHIPSWSIFMQLPPCGLWPACRKGLTAKAAHCLTHQPTNELQTFHIQYLQIGMATEAITNAVSDS
eukprot:jgi/Psemu1/60753/gm1.60753_g